MGGKMKNAIIILSFLFATAIYAQTDFEVWQRSQNEEFINFKNKEDKAFYDFLQKNWRDFSAEKGEKLDTKPKPIKMPVAEVSEPEEMKQGKKIAPLKIEMEEAEKEENVFFAVDNDLPIIEIDYFGLPMDYNYQSDIEVDLSLINEKTIANFWLKASNSDYEKLLEQLQIQKKKMALNDWGYCLLVDKIGNKIGNGDHKKNQLFNWFILLKSGYDCKIGFNEDSVYLLLPSENKMYGISYVVIDEQRYYAVSFAKQKQLKIALNTYEGSYPDADDLIDLSIDRTPKINCSIVEKELKFSYHGNDYKIPVKYDTNAAEFFRNYPQTDLDIYFQAPLSNLAMSSLSEGFAPILQEKTEAEAANILLRFVQTAFEYKTDDEQFGREKSFFSDEVLLYPYCDCEDRSILYSYLIRNLLKLNVIGLDYPCHISTGVNFNSDLSGDFVMYKNSKYLICDPTYINANMGMSMPKYKEMKPKIIELSKTTE